MRRSKVLLASLLFAAMPLHGSEPAAASRPLDLFDLGAPSFTTFSPRDGIPESVTISVQTDRDGFVWLSSPLGLARYDGHRWSMDEAAALPKAYSTLMLDHDGVLWAAYRDFGIAHYDGKRWRLENRSTGLPTDQIRRVIDLRATDGHYTLWACGWEKGLLFRERDHWISDPGNAQLPPGPVIALAQTQSLGGRPRQWIGTFNEGVWYREGDGAWQRYRAPGFETSQIEDIYATQFHGHEELWISGFGSGLWRLTDAGLHAWSTGTGDLPTDQLYDIVETGLPNGDHALWVASRSGLVRIHDDRAQVFDRRHGLPSDVMRGLSAWRSPDGTEVLWLATESGVARSIVGGSQWLTASLMGAHSIGVFATLVEPDGTGGERLWVGSSGDGMGLFEHNRWRTFTQADGALPDNDVRMITRAADSDGTAALWIGLRYGYLLRARDGTKFEPVTAPWERDPGQAVMDMLPRTFDGASEQWFATRQSGIYRKRGDAWTAFRADGVVGQWRVNKLLEQVDANGKSWLWATSNQGLARFDGQRWQVLGRDAGMPDIELTGFNLMRDARQVLWIGTAHAGIVRVDVTDPAHPAVLPADLPPAPDPTAYGALRDSKGRIYICSNNGVQQLTPNGNGYASRVFTRRDGMVHDECNTDAQFLDAHDRFWTGTLGGLTVYDPQREIVDSHAKPLRLTSVRIDGAAAPTDSVHIEPGTRDVRIEFALLSWRREAESRFRTQLVGYDPKPGEWTEQNYRSFSALPPGSYVLHIEARDYAGNASAALDLPIEMAATWWQRGWARLLFVAIALLLAFGLVQWRTRALQKQRKVLELRVDKRTAELNEANARLLELSYKDALTGLANRRRLLETLEQNPGAATQAVPTSLIFVDVDFFKDYNDRFGHPAGDEALRGVARVMRECAPAEALVARYGGEEFACLVPGMAATPALALAERIRAAVARCEIPVPGADTFNRVTISAGVASTVLAGSADAHQLLRSADVALYQAKRDGRNCVRG